MKNKTVVGDMVLYMVAGRRKADPNLSLKDLWPDKTNFFDLWAKFVKGPVEHVELCFVNPGRPAYGFFITRKTRTQRFQVRDFFNAERKFENLEWYEIRNINETACEMYCASMAGKSVMSMLKMIKSAMPIDSTDIAKMLIHSVETITTADPFDGEHTVATNAEFCSSSCLKALQAAGCDFKGVDLDRCTANDAVVLIVQRLGAIKKPKPTFEKFVDEDFVRSEDW